MKALIDDGMYSPTDCQNSCQYESIQNPVIQRRSQRNA